MDIGTVRGLGTLLVGVSFIALLIWALSKARQHSFDEAAQLPFADEPRGPASHE